MRLYTPLEACLRRNSSCAGLLTGVSQPNSARSATDPTLRTVITGR